MKDFESCLADLGNALAAFSDVELTLSERKQVEALTSMYFLVSYVHKESLKSLAK